MKDKLKVSVYNTKYYINQAKKTVTCVLDFELRGPDRFREMLFNFIYLTKDPYFVWSTKNDIFWCCADRIARFVL